MLKAFRDLIAPTPFRGARCLVQIAGSTRVASQPTQPALVHYPYYVPRNTRGNLPVYTDVRNGGTRYLVMIRNVDGNANMLAKDLANTLFERNSPEASRMRIDIIRSKNLVITGGRWKNHVLEWLKEKGF